MTLTIGMCGPVRIADFREHIDPAQWHDDLPPGQGGTPVNLLCRELLRRGERLVVFTCDPTVRDEVVLSGPRLRLCIGPKGQRPARNFFRVERHYLAAAIARERPDVLHAQWTYEYALAAQASGIAHVITAHDAPINIVRHNFIPYRIARTGMAYRVTSRARRIVAVSPHVADHLQRFMLYRGAGEVIPNGMPEHVFTRKARERRDGAGLRFATILVGWGGYKNGQVAIEAFGRVHQTHPDASLVMFGACHGPGEQAQAWARGRGLEAGIEFVGQLPYDQLIQRLADEVDVLVHPALEEAQSMAAIEAMALGIPVIGGHRSGAVPWTLGDGEAGLLVDVHDPQALAAAMQRLADDAPLRNLLGERGRAMTRERFHIGAVASAYQAVYQQLAQQP